MYPLVCDYCLLHGPCLFWESLDGLVCFECEKPDDYEVCETCGFDHSYERQKADEYHSTHLDQTDL